MEVEGILNLRGCVCVYVTSWRPSQREREYMRSSWSNRKGMVKVCVCRGETPQRSCVWCITFPTVWLLPSHQRTKGCLCQAWLIWFLLMSYLPFSPLPSASTHQPPLHPIILAPNGALETTLISFAFVTNPSTYTHTHARTHAQTVQGSCTIPDLAGASLKCAMYSPRLDEAHRQTFIPTWLPPPRAIYTVEKVNCLKHQRCYFSWFQKHCIWY